MVAAALLAALAAGLLSFGGGDRAPPGLAELAQPRGPGSPVIAPLDGADPQTLDLALAALRLAPADRGRVRAGVTAGELKLGLIALWDWADHDSDAVSLASAGFVQRLEIRNEPIVVVVPYRGAGSLRLTGLRDGGGGITVALATASEPLNLRPLRSGESLQVRIP